MITTTGVKAGYRLEVTQDGVRTHTVEINTPDYLKHMVADLTIKPNLFGPTALSVHGAVVHEANLVDQPLMWSPDGSKIMYLAERVSKIVDIHGKVPPTMEGSNLKLQDYLSGSDYKHGWGDSMNGFFNTEIYIYDLTTKILGRAELENDIKPTFPRWIGNDSICFTGYDGTGFPSMLKWCMNKKGGVYAFRKLVTRPVLNFSDTPLFITQELKEKFSQAPLKVSGDDQIAFLPIPGPDDDSILFQFVAKRKDTCRQVAGLKLYRFSTQETTLVLPDHDAVRADGTNNLALWSV